MTELTHFMDVLCEIETVACMTGDDHGRVLNWFNKLDLEYGDGRFNLLVHPVENRLPIG
jgi:hypothetical protein